MDFDSLQADPAPVASPQQPTNQPQSFDSLKDDSETYGTPGQQLQTGAESIAKGLLGPVAPWYETHLMGVPAKEILARQKANPVTAGVGEAAGLGAGMLTGTGEAAVMTKAGELGLEGLGLTTKAGEAAGIAHKIGSSTVQQAIEMGVLAGSDETSKLILQDPNTSAESAVANIGIGTLLGGAFGATGAMVSPLWKATLGPKLEELMNAVTNQVNGKSMIALSEGIGKDLETLGVAPTALQRADLADTPFVNRNVANLIRAENSDMLAEREALKQSVAESVVKPLGSTMEDMRVYDNDEAGRQIANAVNDRIKTTFQPLWRDMDERDRIASMLTTSDDSKLALMDRLRERGVTDFAPMSPHADLFYDAGERQLSFKTIADFDKYDSELRSNLNKAQRAGDFEQAKAFSTIRNTLKDYKNQVIQASAAGAEQSGLKGATEAGENLIAQRNALNKQYAMAEGVREELGDHFNISSRNSRDFMKQLDENMTPEQVLKKFSIKNNMNGAKFLQDNFPEAFQEVIKNERRAVLKPAINSGDEDAPINVKKLGSIIEKAKAGKDNYLKTILPQDFLDKAEAGGRVLQQMTSPKDSGTPAGMWGIVKHLGGSALGAAGLLMGHSPLAYVVAGEAAARLGKEGPEAARLAFLRYIGSTEPISAPGFKAMASFISGVQKNQDVLATAVKNTLKPGAMVIAANALPGSKDRDRLEKALNKVQNSPDQFTQGQNTELGHYMQQHQQAMSATQTRIAQYLQTLKPKTNQPGVLDREVPASSADKTRYARAQDIAINPNIVLAKVKNGTLQTSDIQDLNSMYPGLYNQMMQKLTNEMGSVSADKGALPYKTRMSLSLFLGSPLDSTMQPMSIQAAQASLQPQQPPEPQGKSRKVTKEAGKGLQKGAAKYQTPDQAAEADRTSRD